MFCQSNTCHTSAFGSAALPDCTPAGDDSTDRCGIRGFVDAYTTSDTLELYGSIESWDVSGVKNMAYIFYYKSTFNADLSKWNVERVENMKMGENSFFIFLRVFFSWI